LALEEIKKYHSPNLTQFEISNHFGQVLAKKYKVDKDIVFLGTCLMDLKIGQAIKENRLQDHIRMSAEAAQKFLTREKVEQKIINTIIHCVEAHHGTIKYQSKEAEVVANADCYRFLTFRGVIAFITMVGKREINLDEIIDFVDQKAEEKWHIVSLPGVKKELGPNYKAIKKFVKGAGVVK